MVSGAGRQPGAFTRLLCYALYHLVGKRLPPYRNWAKVVRRTICRGMFARMGHNVTVEKNAQFGSGRYVEIGDNSGIGMNCRVSHVRIGKDVMMGPDCVLLSANHRHDDLTTPMIEQGYLETQTTVIDDDVWIGTRVVILPGRHLGAHSIIGAGAVVTRDVPPYAIVGGNPARVIGWRKEPDASPPQDADLPVKSQTDDGDG